MTRALALEISGPSGSVALAVDGRVIAQITFEHGLRRAANLVPAVDRLCSDSGWAPADLAHVYVSVGPGSFTGLRVGVTLAKTLALAVGCRIVAVPSLRALAENAAPDAGRVLATVGAGRGNVFAALYERRGGGWVERTPVRQLPLADAVADAGAPVAVVSGDATPPTAAAVATVGWAMAAAGTFADPDTLVPLYVRRPDPEEKRLAAGG